jgi:hypothetical protein
MDKKGNSSRHLLESSRAQLVGGHLRQSSSSSISSSSISSSSINISRFCKHMAGGQKHLSAKSHFLQVN